MDTIHLSELRFFGHHGVLPEETRDGQTFTVSAVLETDLRPAGCNDDLDKSIDYREAVRLIREVVEGPPVRLLETLAERIAENLLGAFPSLQAVTVAVGKPEPPLDTACSGVFVEIRRGRQPSS